MPGSDDTSHRLNISIHKIKHPKAFEAISYYKEKKEVLSSKYNEGLVKLYEEEKRRNEQAIIEQFTDEGREKYQTELPVLDVSFMLKDGECTNNELWARVRKELSREERGELYRRLFYVQARLQQMQMEQFSNYNPRYYNNKMHQEHEKLTHEALDQLEEEIQQRWLKLQQAKQQLEREEKEALLLPPPPTQQPSSSSPPTQQPIQPQPQQQQSEQQFGQDNQTMKEELIQSNPKEQVIKTDKAS